MSSIYRCPQFSATCHPASYSMYVILFVAMDATIIIQYSQTSLIRSSFIRIPRHPEENRWLPIYSICHAYIQYVCSDYPVPSPIRMFFCFFFVENGCVRLSEVWLYTSPVGVLCTWAWSHPGLRLPHTSVHSCKIVWHMAHSAWTLVHQPVCPHLPGWHQCNTLCICILLIF